MIDFEYLPEVVQPSPTKIVMVVVDGLGGMKDPNVGKTELEMFTAKGFSSCCTIE